LESRAVSRLHALVQRMDRGEFCLIDLGSRNGSFVNGRRVSIPVTLRHNDLLVCGDQPIRFHDPGAAAEPGQPRTEPRNVPTSAMLTHTNVTIVVVDIRDYTRIARSVPEEVLSQTLGTWFLRVGQITQELGSWAQKYIGDAVMAVWVHASDGIARPDLMRALEAVCRIRTVTEEIGGGLPIPWRVGAGVNTGPAIIGMGDSTALGDTVNLAFRLEEATKTLGLGVALGSRTFDALQLPAASPAPFERREVQLKGYEGATTAWAISFDALTDFAHNRPQ
jgi:adenylate cyclase